METALDRSSWQRLEDDWLRHNGLDVLTNPANVIAVPDDKHFWEKRCLQGAYHGQQVFVADVGSLATLNILELDRSAGWRKHTGFAWDLTAANLIMEVANTEWILPATFHIRLLLFESSTDLTHVEQILREAPFRCEIFQQHFVVIEMSRLLGRWVGEMKQLVDNLSC